MAEFKSLVDAVGDVAGALDEGLTLHHIPSQMVSGDAERVAAALDNGFDLLSTLLKSPNEQDSNGEVANIVDGLYFIGRALLRCAEAIEKLGKKGE